MKKKKTQLKIKKKAKSFPEKSAFPLKKVKLLPKKKNFYEKTNLNKKPSKKSFLGWRFFCWGENKKPCGQTV